ncbi:homoserine O-succinyltransferase [Sedimentibacter hydroxybenzoicus DSM 7310]|uniref:Homoserine O-acetyltransferase n=1 Tax=Sedimentibacter hydroxybenzoicus DSM 7310 TaxID=1123245 RepID=A0A974GVF3_SEDHY|nr:homoserine O-succinyltransferase [Sedimentibacter hydroxybenzoicus]NYB73281.1 homoserine O-succinyltransferase [Sedimentibacter hydroxybenzoicus DSM 7310]
MPVIIPSDLPAYKTMENENIFVMSKERAESQDIRPLEIALVNLMPTKIDTETQFVRLLSNSPIQINVEFIHTGTHESKNTSESHMKSFYKSISEVRSKKYDGMIVTGAPVELMEFEDVDYWDELKEVLEFSHNNVTSAMYICWGAQAALNYFYGLQKKKLTAKLFGVFEHEKKHRTCMLLNGFDDIFYVPHSRHTEIQKSDIEAVKELFILAESEKAGVHIASTDNYSKIFIMGHSEYDPLTLKKEYDRDISQGKEINIPINYYPDDNPLKTPFVKWRSHANLLFKNWINVIYQETPYDINDIGKQ